MALSNDLISQFVKVTRDKEETATESTAYGKIVKKGDVEYVQLDGSELLTPISSTTVVKDGDRVMVTIKNHTAVVTGDFTNPSASNKDVTEIGNKISEFEIIIADKVSTEQLEAEIAKIDTLVTDEFKATNANIETLNTKVAEIDTIKADVLDVSGKVAANEAEIDTLKADIADFKDVTAESIEAIEGDFHNIESDYADFKNITTNDLTAAKADIEELESKKIDTETANAKFANIDFSNIGEAAIEKLFSESGIIEDLIMSDGKVTGHLVGVTITGDLIEGNTVKADKLVIQGEDGLYYKLNVNALGETTAKSDPKYQNGLDGSIIVAESITAEKIAVDDLVAFGATIGGFNITNHSIYSGTKNSINNTTRGIYLSDGGQINIGDSNNFLKFFVDENGKYKLVIQADTIKLSSSGKTIEETIAEAKPEISKDINGNRLVINDGSKVIDFKVDGKSYQETRSSKNVFNVADIESDGYTEILSTEESSFTLAGAWASRIMSIENVLKYFEPNTAYIATAKLTVLTRPTTLSSYNHNCILTLYNGTQGYNVLISNDKNNWEINDVIELTNTFTTPNDLTNFKIIAYNYHGNSDGSTTYYGSGSFKIENLMIRKATETEGSFDTYGYSKNQLMGFKKGETSYFYSITNTVNSDTYFYRATPLEDNWLRVECERPDSSTGHNYINFQIGKDKLPNLKANTTYTIVVEFRNVNITQMDNTLFMCNTHDATNVGDDTFEQILYFGNWNITEGAIHKLLINTTSNIEGSVPLRNFHTTMPGDKFSYDMRLSVLKGDYTNIDYEYEDYGITPSKDYPSEIKSVGYENILDIPSEYTVSVYSSKAINLEPGIYRFSVDSIETTTEESQLISLTTTLDTTLYLYLSKTVLSKSIILDTPVKSMAIYSANKYATSVGVNTTYVNLRLTKELEPREYISYGNYGIDVRHSSKNLLKGLSTPVDDINYWYTVTSPYFTPLENGWGRFTYDNTNGSSVVFINAKVKLFGLDLQPNTEYTIITEIRNSNISENSGAYLVTASNNPTIAWTSAVSIGYKAINTGGIYYKCVTTKDNFINVDCAMDTYMRLAPGTKGTIEARISVIEGRVNINEFVYEEYKSHTTVLELDQPLRSLPNGVKDVAYVQNGKLYVDRKIGSIVLNGTEGWSKSGSTTIDRYYLDINNALILDGAVGICNYFQNVAFGSENIGFYFGIYYGTPQVERIFINYAAYGTSTLEQFKTWLSTHNTEVLYELETPIVEEIGPITIPMHKDLTDIYYIKDSLIPNIYCKYFTDYAESIADVDAFNDKNLSDTTEALQLEITNQRTNILADTEILILEAATEYVKTGDYDTFKSTVEAQLSVMSSEITMRFTNTNNDINELKTLTSDELATIKKYFQFNEDGVTIGSGESAIKLKVDNDDGIEFTKNGEIFGYWDGNDFYTGNIKVRVNERAQFGAYGYVPRSDKSLMFLKID